MFNTTYLRNMAHRCRAGLDSEQCAGIIEQCANELDKLYKEKNFDYDSNQCRYNIIVIADDNNVIASLVDAKTNQQIPAKVSIRRL